MLKLNSTGGLLSTRLSLLMAIGIAGTVLSASQPATAASLTPVDTELSLLMDVSGSISNSEFALQIKGYSDAFKNLAPRFGNDLGTAAVNLIFWGSTQREVLPWFLINDAASALEFSNQIAVLKDPGLGGTDPDLAIAFAAPLFFQNAFDGKRQIIDVSGDGIGNTTATARERDNALALGVDTINGIAITNGNSFLKTWYENNIRGGANAFVLSVNDSTQFGVGIQQKLTAELTVDTVNSGDTSAAVPEPSTVLLATGAGVLGGFFKRRRDRQKLSAPRN
jgi:Protein of unknown function (DUF1194)/PEP-CTERM motif